MQKFNTLKEEQEYLHGLAESKARDQLVKEFGQEQFYRYVDLEDRQERVISSWISFHFTERGGVKFYVEVDLLGDYIKRYLHETKIEHYGLPENSTDSDIRTHENWRIKCYSLRISPYRQFNHICIKKWEDLVEAKFDDEVSTIPLEVLKEELDKIEKWWKNQLDLTPEHRELVRAFKASGVPMAADAERRTVRFR